MLRFDTLKEKVLDAVFQLQSVCCQPSAKVKIGGRSFQIIKVLGEGGFSFVYLAQDVESGVSSLCLPYAREHAFDDLTGLELVSSL